MNYHIPVLLEESISGLNLTPTGRYVDCTFGGGGHAKEIAKNLTTGKLYAFDQDVDAAQNAQESENIVFVRHNFRHFKRFLKLHNAIPVDGILADLGISSHQIDTAERGFSTRFEAELDMRMNREEKINANTIINEYSEEKLAEIFKKFGEIKNARPLARAIVSARKTEPVRTITQLKRIVSAFTNAKSLNKYLAQVFQALRIEVNDEIEALKEMLLHSTEVLKTGGRLVVISYHSLEDRLVKNFMKTGKLEGEADRDFYGNQVKPFKMITKKPIVPSAEEIKRNPRSRSAKLRIAEKIA